MILVCLISIFIPPEEILHNTGLTTLMTWYQKEAGFEEVIVN